VDYHLQCSFLAALLIWTQPLQAAKQDLYSYNISLGSQCSYRAINEFNSNCFNCMTKKSHYQSTTYLSWHELIVKQEVFGIINRAINFNTVTRLSDNFDPVLIMSCQVIMHRLFIIGKALTTTISPKAMAQ